jgi:hypothetical protein
MLAAPATAAPSRAPLLDPIERFRLFSCAGKVAHASKHVARRVARSTHGGCDDLGRLHAYRCDFCYHWHVGHGAR